MTGKLLLALAASSAIVGSGQFLRPTVVQSFSSSWTSSSSWLPGRDGQMHRQVHEVRTETFRDHGMAVKRTESETACRDGLCRQTGFPFSVVHIKERVEPVSGKFLAPRSQPALDVAPFANKHTPAMDIMNPSVVISLAALAGAGISLAALLAAALAKCTRVDSREVPLRTLGEPLAPAQDAAAPIQHVPCQLVPAIATATPKEVEAAVEGMPVGAYLQNVYERAAAAAEVFAAKAYVRRVYERAAV